MLRLDPAFPPLWRSATTLQFGADPVVVIDDPEPWQQRLIRELESGIPDASLDPTAMALGAPENAAETFVRRIARALCPPATPRPRIALQSPHGFPRERLDLVAESLGAAGVDVSPIIWFGAPAERVEASAPVVVLAHHVVEPRRAAALMSGDIPHVPLVFTASGAEIGPFVVPGRTACLACLAAHRCDADPAWPLLVAQLLGRPAPAASRAMVMRGVVRDRAADQRGRAAAPPLPDAPRGFPPPLDARPPAARRVPVPISRRNRDGCRSRVPRDHDIDRARPARVMPT